MRILLATALAIVLAASACCCGGGGDPIVRATAASCGEVRVSATVSSGLPRTIRFEHDDGSGVDVDVGLFETEVEARIPAAGTAMITVRDGGGTRTYPVPEVPPVRVALVPVGKPVEGEVVRARVTAAAEPTCTFAGTLHAQLTAEDGSLAKQSGDMQGSEAELAFTGLSAGLHQAELALVDPHGMTAATGTVTLTVLPPCVDEDGDGYKACDGDCDDRDPEVHPGAKDRAGDGIDNDCDGVNGTDRDHDGHEDVAVGGDDCNDYDDAIHPGASTTDRDGDGYFSGPDGADLDCNGTPDVAMGQGGDCDDTKPGVHPQSAEPPTGNGIDDDCDGTIDEGTNLFDDDGDGQTEDEGDCDDADIRRYTGHEEVYDCVDNNCDGKIDEGTTPREVDDRFEPNDDSSVRLSEAQRNWLGGYKPTHDVVNVVSRDGKDTERFSIVAHDGLLDNFGVDVTLVEGAQNARYEIIIAGPTGMQKAGTVAKAGSVITYSGTADHADSGVYEIAITPQSSDLAWCPATFAIHSR
ncbi:MAG: hypothetical protein EP330_19350 [Deltaproteobacteria bacterium]|nr:MAG: hypothetical protein EP330_19350 [Deltaproteobacteria bacterium]